MSHKIKIYIIAMGLLLFGFMQLSVAGSGNFFGSSALAACTGNPDIDAGDPTCPKPGAPGGGAAADANCSDSSNAGIATCLKNNKIVTDLNLIVNFLSAAVGIAVVGSIIVGGIQYSMASGNANSTQAARKRLTDAFIALFAFIFVFAFLQWLIPGGL